MFTPIGSSPGFAEEPGKLVDAQSSERSPANYQQRTATTVGDPASRLSTLVRSTTSKFLFAHPAGAVDISVFIKTGSVMNCPATLVPNDERPAIMIRGFPVSGFRSLAMIA